MSDPNAQKLHLSADRDIKIWRYIDLQKYVSLLATRCLYFPRPSSFNDPYEGWLPKSHLAAYAQINQNFIDQHNDLRGKVAALHPDADLTSFNAGIDANLEIYIARARTTLVESAENFGISCWHRSDYESESMWRAYPAECVAIESTVGRLADAAQHDKTITISAVRYADFENDPIEKGHREYHLFMKRLSFAHEQELRACAFLGVGTGGVLLPYDLDTLITQIHVSPRATSGFLQAVTDLSAGTIGALNKPIIASRLYDKPDYNMELRLK
jgi:hypothetical protein